MFMNLKLEKKVYTVNILFINVIFLHKCIKLNRFVLLLILTLKKKEFLIKKKTFDLNIIFIHTNFFVYTKL